jgi:tRNA-splicing endonuclease subunit Sen2
MPHGHEVIDSETSNYCAVPSDIYTDSASSKACDSGHHRLESVDSSNVICRKSGSGFAGTNSSIADSQCLETDSDGDVLVMDDTDDSDIDDSVRSSRPVWQTICKKDPYPLTEHLQLSLEEAFFLSYGLGCLVVNTGNKEDVLNLTEMWKRFCRISPNFVERYVVYHNFRSKGWVPKPGLKFGADFLLYKQGPPFYHASYSVIVKQVRDADLLPVDLTGQQQMGWTMLSCLNRITEQVSKELMICYVIRPAGLHDSEFHSPLCISKFKLLEVVMRRWISKRERENAEFLVIP